MDASLKKEDILSILRRHTPEVHEKYRVIRMGLFGSYAMGSATEESDIDILVEFEPGADIWDLAGLKIYLENLFKKQVDVATVNSLRPEMKGSILANIAYS
ncbi:MAG: nucleotidyltransferase family protein [Methanospirillum sp.]|uniref:nucleotidyltransferase family protein n=1 Tax=Methanospirillum sp. TaxID=45200 RepID=UPI00236CEDFA|nr:nucleotidyltransferase family protein [Methanospirillum sp.]MDD1729416.1 nucleotidyltransferase family protein [Methanospirillum sp.]